MLLHIAACGEPDRSKLDSVRERARSAMEANRRYTSAPATPESPVARPLALPVESAIRRPFDPSSAEVAPDRYQSARLCGACHEEIFEKWSQSMHSLSYTDPIFMDAFLRAYYASAGEAAEQCLGCHSPTAVETGDLLGKSELTREGVTCDYCHSISSVSEDSTGKLTHAVSHDAVHGPGRSTDGAEHEVVEKAYFERSEICAGCHDYTTPDGTVVFATYGEWKASRYASEGTHCQDCHMPRLESTSRRGSDASPKQFNDHHLQGGHSPTQIKKALDVDIEESVRDSDRVRIVVAVENSGAGHSVPTGLPSRMLVLTVDARQRGQVIFRRETVYQRVMQGADQRELVEDWEIKLLSKRVLRDNRIRSGEKRRETFVFDATPTEDIEIRVRVAYRYQPKIATGQVIEVPIKQLERILSRGL